MSTRDQHLEWIEQGNYDPGLWDVGSGMTMPAQAGSIVTDCVPFVGGGLRAALKPQALTVSGIGTGEAIQGLYGVPEPLGIDFYAWTIKSDASMRLYRMNQNASETTWTQRGSTFTSTQGLTTEPDLFQDSTGATFVVFNNYALSSASGGVWTLARASNTVTRQLAVNWPGPLAVQDDRIIASVAGTGSIFSSVLRWTDSQSVSSWPAANNLPVQASRNGNNMALIIPKAPSDLLIGFTGAPWVAVQGDITQPLVRSMSGARVPSYPHKGAQTNNGIAFLNKYAISLTGDGSSFVDIDQQLNRLGNHLSAHTLAYLDDTLLAGYGFTYDFLSKSWYVQSELNTGAGIVSCSIPAANIILAATGGTSPALYLYSGPYGSDGTSARRSTYTWKTAPLHRNDGRQIRIREVQCYVETYDADATVAVTVNGTTRTVTVPSAGKQVTKHLFVESDETLDVQIVTAAGDTANEAPFLEQHRIGHQAGHLLGL